MSASCVRAELLGESARELADVFCQQSRLRVAALFDSLWANTDQEDSQVAAATLDGRYSWLEAGVLDQSEGTGPWIADWQASASGEQNVARRYLSSTRSDAPA